jgi:RimJ/RimL family protein N-acetyltransferase
MAQALTTLARESASGIRVTAQTLPEANASTRILEKLGFSRAGTAFDADVGVVWAWELAALPGPPTSSGGGP